ncbi:hypothetical protein K439DRAFT_656346 [Ramaria rubella]|nr:hypothetical protein K439DRAFT_656346 [Ramaria rubella]
MKSSPAKTSPTLTSPKTRRQVHVAYEDSDADSEIEVQEQQVNGKTTSKSVEASERRDLVSRAFVLYRVSRSSNSEKWRPTHRTTKTVHSPARLTSYIHVTHECMNAH